MEDQEVLKQLERSRKDSKTYRMTLHALYIGAVLSVCGMLVAVYQIAQSVAVEWIGLGGYVTAVMATLSMHAFGYSRQTKAMEQAVRVAALSRPPSE